LGFTSKSMRESDFRFFPFAGTTTLVPNTAPLVLVWLRFGNWFVLFQENTITPSGKTPERFTGRLLL
jgi:hypothetical protein